MIVEGTFNMDLFAGFITNLLQYCTPFPGPRSVIIMDNCPIHKSLEIHKLIEGRYESDFEVQITY